MTKLWSLSSSLLLLAAMALGVTAIYPEDHFDRVEKLSASNFDSFVQTEIDAGRTVFVRWIASPN